MGLFTKGYKEVEKAKQQQEERSRNNGKKLWDFFIPQPPKGKRSVEVEGRFLTEEPINFYEHLLVSHKGGKERYDSYVCTGDDCPFCDDGDRPSFKSAFLFLDYTENDVTDNTGKTKTYGPSVKLLKWGTKSASQLDRISSKYGLSCRDVTIIRFGKGTDTSYTVERGEKSKLTEEEISEYLPEALRDDYDGSMDSLYSIIEDQLLMRTGFDEDVDDDADEEDGEVYDDEEEEKPSRAKKPSSGKKLSAKSGKASLKKNKSLFKMKGGR